MYIYIFFWMLARVSVLPSLEDPPMGFLTGFSLARLKLRVPAQVSRSASAISIRADRLGFFWLIVREAYRKSHI